MNVYIDGFNLFYGALKGTPYKWLDLVKLARNLLPDDEINRVRYFTARVSPQPDKPHATRNQHAYLRALSTLPEVSIHLGHFLHSTPYMRLLRPPPTGARVHKMEEKGSDVKLAVNLVADAYEGDCELAVVISNDSDLIEAMCIARQRCGVQVGILCPAQRPSQAIKEQAQPLFTKPIRSGALGRSQLPPSVELPDGAVIVRPRDW